MHPRDVVGEVPRLDATEIQEIADDSKQVLLASANAVEVLKLFLADGAAETEAEKVRVTANCVERCAQLVRHRSEKLGLGPVRRLGLCNPARIGDCPFLRCATLGQIPGDLR